MNKKGSHVGMILSFVIFITFIIYLISILGPSIQVERNKDYLVGSLKEKVISNISSGINITTIKINGNIPSSCMKISNFEYLSDDNIIIKDKDGNSHNYKRTGTDLTISNPSGDIYLIHYSNELIPEAEANGNCQNQVTYQTAFTSEENYASLEKAKKVIRDINSESYEFVKESFGVPPGNNFQIAIQYNNGTIEGLNDIGIKTTVSADQVPILYFDNQANINSGFIIIRIW